MDGQEASSKQTSKRNSKQNRNFYLHSRENPLGKIDLAILPQRVRSLVKQAKTKRLEHASKKKSVTPTKQVSNDAVEISFLQSQETTTTTQIRGRQDVNPIKQMIDYTDGSIKHPDKPQTLPSTQSGTSASAAGGESPFVFHIVYNRQLLARDLLEEEEGGGGVNVLPGSSDFEDAGGCTPSRPSTRSSTQLTEIWSVTTAVSINSIFRWFLSIRY